MSTFNLCKLIMLYHKNIEFAQKTERLETNEKPLFCTNIGTNLYRKLVYLYVKFYPIQALDEQNYRIIYKLFKNQHKLSVLSLHDDFFCTNSKFAQKHRVFRGRLNVIVKVLRNNIKHPGAEKYILENLSSRDKIYRMM